MSQVHRIVRLAIALSLAALLSSGPALQNAARAGQGATMQILRENDIGGIAEIGSGETVELRLPENRSTGFRWLVTADGSPTCAIDRDAFDPPAQPMPGAGGEHVWQFRGVRAGECRVELAYRRPWDEAKPPERVFHVSIRVLR